MTLEPSSSDLRPRLGFLQPGGLPLASQDSHSEASLQSSVPTTHSCSAGLMPLQFVPRPVGGSGFVRPRRLASPSRRPHILEIEAAPFSPGYFQARSCAASSNYAGLSLCSIPGVSPSSEVHGLRGVDYAWGTIHYGFCSTAG